MLLPYQAVLVNVDALPIGTTTYVWAITPSGVEQEPADDFCVYLGSEVTVAGGTVDINVKNQPGPVVPVLKVDRGATIADATQAVNGTPVNELKFLEFTGGRVKITVTVAAQIGGKASVVLMANRPFTATVSA